MNELSLLLFKWIYRPRYHSVAVIWPTLTFLLLPNAIDLCASFYYIVHIMDYDWVQTENKV